MKNKYIILALALLATSVKAQTATEEQFKLAAAEEQFKIGFAEEPFRLSLMYHAQWLLDATKEEDSAEAVQWLRDAVELLRTAADQGDSSAQTNLGVMYYNGEGVPKDLVQACAWWNIAGANGSEVANKNLEIVEKEVTFEQKAKAMKLASELFAKTANHNTAACAVKKRSPIDLNPNTAGKYQPFIIKKFNSYNYL